MDNLVKGLSFCALDDDWSSFGLVNVRQILNVKKGRFMTFGDRFDRKNACLWDCLTILSY